jgi:hypothetical protein
MPGPLLHQGATVMCAHGGQAQPMAPNPRVLVSGMPTVTIATTYAIVGCTFAPTVGNGPCVTAQFVTAAVRITSNGQPLLLLDSQALCAPTGTPLMPPVAQTRVIGS